jgi:hypothetical protein
MPAKAANDPLVAVFVTVAVDLNAHLGAGQV